VNRRGVRYGQREGSRRLRRRGPWLSNLWQVTFFESWYHPAIIRLLVESSFVSHHTAVDNDQIPTQEDANKYQVNIFQIRSGQR
jgi:hypothetical protein